MTTVMVTGANSGIGAAATAALLDRGAEVVATVRSRASAAKVRDAHPGAARLSVKLLDVTDAEQCARVVDEVRPDVLVNSAGDALLGAVVDIDESDARDEFDTLVFGPVRLALAAAAHQRVAGGGRIVNVSSTTADAALPFTGWYAAAKSALDALTDVLRLELGPDGIDVISIDCGAIATPAWDDAGEEVRSGQDPATREGRRRWAALTDLARPAFGDPDDVGAAIAAAALDRRPKAVYRVGFGARLGLLSHVTPDPIEEAITRAVFALRGRR